MPIARLSRRTNQFPTIVRLMTESALCPSPRVRVISTASQRIPLMPLISVTTVPNARATVVRTVRLPNRSSRRPMPRQKIEPSSVAQRLICANITRSISTSKCSPSIPRILQWSASQFPTSNTLALAIANLWHRSSTGVRARRLTDRSGLLLCQVIIRPRRIVESCLCPSRETP